MNSCVKVNHIAGYKAISYQMNDSISPVGDLKIDSLIKPYKKQVDIEINKVIGYSAKNLNMSFPESTLGNFVADLIFRKAKQYNDDSVDFAFINYWSIKIDGIPKGAINKGQIYELMPFENHLVILKVGRDEVFQLFENMAKKGGWPVSKQVKFQIADEKPINIFINGKPLEDDKTYHIALSNYLANGGDGCSFFKGKDRDEINILIRDLIMQGIIDQERKGEPITAKIEGRISLKE